MRRVFLRALGLRTDEEILKTFYTVDTINVRDGKLTWAITEDGKPTNILGTRTTSRPLFPGDFEDVSLVWNAPNAGQIVVTVNEAPAAPPTRSQRRSGTIWRAAPASRTTSSTSSCAVSRPSSGSSPRPKRNAGRRTELIERIAK